MEKKYIELADGRQVRRGPWIDKSGFWRMSERGFRIGVYAISEHMLQHGEQWGDVIILLEVEIPVNYSGTVKLPIIRVTNKELWAKALTTEVVRVLRQSTRDQKALDYGKIRIIKQSGRYKKEIKYIVGKVSRVLEKEKELILPDGRRLVGDLGFTLDWSRETIAHDDLHVWGNIKGPTTEETERTLLLTIKDLYHLLWPGSIKEPSWTKNKEVWCKKLEFVVVNYLNLLVDFASPPLKKQIRAIVSVLAGKSEWAVICHNVLQKLLSLNPEDREDEKITRALELIDEVDQI